MVNQIYRAAVQNGRAVERAEIAAYFDDVAVDAAEAKQAEFDEQMDEYINNFEWETEIYDWDAEERVLNAIEDAGGFYDFNDERDYWYFQKAA